MKPSTDAASLFGPHAKGGLLMAVTASEVYIVFVVPGAIACLDLVLHKHSTVKRARVHRVPWLLAGIIFSLMGLLAPIFALVYLVGPHRKIRRITGPGPIGRVFRYIGQGFGGRPGTCFECRGSGYVGLTTTYCANCGGTGSAPTWDKRGR